MKPNSLGQQPLSSENSEFAVYQCEIRLKFKLIEEKKILNNREQLLELLLDAFSYGADEYLEPIQTCVEAEEIVETEASPQMRRQLIRLRNFSSDLT